MKASYKLPFFNTCCKDICHKPFFLFQRARKGYLFVFFLQKITSSVNHFFALLRKSSTIQFKSETLFEEGKDRKIKKRSGGLFLRCWRLYRTGLYRPLLFFHFRKAQYHDLEFITFFFIAPKLSEETT